MVVAVYRICAVVRVSGVSGILRIGSGRRSLGTVSEG